MPQICKAGCHQWRQGGGGGGGGVYRINMLVGTMNHLLFWIFVVFLSCRANVVGNVSGKVSRTARHAEQK
jgi:hypothetical protein